MIVKLFSKIFTVKYGSNPKDQSRSEKKAFDSERVEKK
jgi:hypothetical protein